MIPRTSACSCGPLHTVSVLRRWERSIQPALDWECFEMLPVSGKRKANPALHLYSVLPATCHFHLNLRTSTRITSGCGCRGLESISGNRDRVIELHDTLAWPASTRLCAHAATQPGGRSLSAGSDYTGFILELHVQIESHRNPREKEAPSTLTAKQKRAQAPWDKALTEPPYNVALRATTACLLLGPEHRPYLVNV